LSYESKIIDALKESERGLSTLEVAKRAGISKTAAIKYLATFRMAGKADYVEAGPLRLWRLIIPKKVSKRGMASKEREIRRLLKGFVEEADLVGSAVVSHDGSALAVILPPNIDYDRVEAVATTLFRAGVRSSDLANLERFKEIRVDGEKGKILAYNGDKFLILAFCKPETMLGTVKIEMEKLSKKVDEILSKR